MKNDVVLMLENGKRDSEWFDSNLANLKNIYNEQFVAFRNQKILDSDKNLDILLKKLDEKKIDRSNVLIEFVSKLRRTLFIS